MLSPTLCIPVTIVILLVTIVTKSNVVSSPSRQCQGIHLYHVNLSSSHPHKSAGDVYIIFSLYPLTLLFYNNMVTLYNNIVTLYDNMVTPA